MTDLAAADAPDVAPLDPAYASNAVALACAMAVQDAVAYLRNTEIIASAAVGAATERIMADLEPEAARAAMDAALAAVSAAAAALVSVGEAAARTLRDFPAG